MAAPARIVWPEKPLAQLVGVKIAAPQNGNGKHERKGVVINYPPELFWNSALNSPFDYTVPTIAGFNAYAISALAYSCMRYRATKLIEAPLWISEETLDGDVWLDDNAALDHPLAALLEQPNPDMEMSDLLEALSLYLDVTGRCLLVKSRDRGKRTAALYPFSGDEFSVSAADGRLYGKFRVRTSSGIKDYGPDDVIFFKNFDPRSPIDGLGPLDAALAHINIGDEMRRAVQAALRNTIRPGAVVEYENALSDADFERARAEMTANYAGAQNTGKVISVEGGKLKMFERGLKDLELGPVQADVESAVCSCFQVHPSVIGTKLGLTANSGLADTIKPATELFYDMYLFPTWNKIARTLTKSLLREVDDNELRTIRFVTENVRFLQDDLGERTTEASNAQGYWTLNEQRTHTGKPALGATDPRGDAIVARATPGASAGQQVPAASGKSVTHSPDPASSVPVTLPKVAGNPALDAETKADARNRLWRKFDVKARRKESDYEREAEKQFERERADVYKRLSGSSDATIIAALEKVQAAYTREEGQYHLEWLKRYEALISDTFKIAGEDLAAELGFDFNLSNPRVELAILNRTNHLAGHVTTTTYQAIKDVVADSRGRGEGISKLADRIRDEVFGGDITKARATTIARTETIGALNAGEAIAAQESGVIRSKEWLSQGDARVRDSHAEIDGTSAPLDGFFGNGLEYPGDQRGSADEVINCRCTVLYSDEEAGKAAAPVLEKKAEEARLPNIHVNVTVPERSTSLTLESSKLRRIGTIVRDEDGNATIEITEVDPYNSE